MDGDDLGQPIRVGCRRELQAEVLQDDGVDDGRVRMERCVQLSGEGSLDPAGGAEKLRERAGEIAPPDPARSIRAKNAGCQVLAERLKR